MKANYSRRKSPSIGKTRWAAYAAAGAATALGGSHSLEAAIHYSGLINAVVRGGENTVIRTFPLEGAYNLSFVHKNGVYAGFRIYSHLSAYRAFIGFSFFVSKLSFGRNISAGPFVRTDLSYWGAMAYNGGSRVQWNDRGVGFIGFSFKGSGGVPRYGWARVKMLGEDKDNFYKLVDYAYADPGEPIFAGQRSSDEQARDQGSPDEGASDEGSLGGLALGAAGLLAWRKSRSRTAR